jgi:hypothetical protein
MSKGLEDVMAFLARGDFDGLRRAGDGRYHQFDSPNVVFIGNTTKHTS